MECCLGLSATEAELSCEPIAEPTGRIDRERPKPVGDVVIVEPVDVTRLVEHLVEFVWCAELHGARAVPAHRSSEEREGR